jgi:hypothetical protein
MMAENIDNGRTVQSESEANRDEQELLNDE